MQESMKEKGFEFSWIPGFLIAKFVTLRTKSEILEGALWFYK
jgi:hypothetical protein